MKLCICTTLDGKADSAYVSYGWHKAVYDVTQASNVVMANNRISIGKDLTRARSILVKTALDDPEMSHVLFWDTDNYPNDMHVLPFMLNLGKDFVFCPYPRKNLHFESLESEVRDETEQAELGRQTEEELCRSTLEFFARPYGQPEPFTYKGHGARKEYRICRVYEAPMGFTLLSRSCLERMVERYRTPPGERSDGRQWLTFSDRSTGKRHDVVGLFHLMYRTNDGFDELISEDFSFSYRWRDMGGEIWMVDSPVSHVGAYAFGGTLK